MMSKNSDLIQLGTLAIIGVLAYNKLAKAKSPVNTQTPGGLQPSRQIVNTPLDPDFGITDPNAGWDDAQSQSTLQKIIEWAW